LFLVGQAPHHRDHRLFGSRDKHRADDFRGDLPARRLVPAIAEGDAFHRYDRETMQEKMIDMHRQGYANFSHFGPEANLFEELEALFREYGERGTGKVRRYLHNEEDARPHGLKAGMFTPWEDLPAGSDVLFYEGLHGE
jgi:phosphoribulokinase